MAYSPDLLTSLQRRILESIGGRIENLFLTGGTALGAVHLGHRTSVDIDLFTRDAEGYPRFTSPAYRRE